MKNQEKPKKRTIKIEISGSETLLEKIKRKTPWIFGTWIRKPKIIFPKLRFRKLHLPLPPKSLSYITIFIILFLLQTGIVYLILREPPALGADPENNPVFIWPQTIHEAFIIESIVASILMFLASSGFFLLYHASKHIYNKKFADWIIIIAILMISIAFGLLQLMLRAKIPKPTIST